MNRYSAAGEYLTRIGWMLDTSHIWIQALSRDQRRVSLLVGDTNAIDAVECKWDAWASQDNAALPDALRAVYTEHVDHPHFIGVHDHFDVIKYAPGAQLVFQWSNEQADDNQHLHWVTVNADGTTKTKQMTGGDWLVDPETTVS